ncbi:FUSC family protein [Cellulomonas sp. PhB143]|uniref:FUSC family protein n=1 Tax=Cellulomonas sp. PhB143 TaxID=2485186 RepID=UPI000F4AE1B3|nr:FUSC family protein [Cellulomonas sp. PhB143]ROS78859.1 fusaric acid resistance family protein [Cellulomonas sp. PhB143]
MVPPVAERAMRSLVLRARVRQGTSRVRSAFWPIVQASLAAALAYLVGVYVFGHPYPIYAPIAAWVCLGFTSDRQIRKVAELGVGVAIGVGIGGFVVHWIGDGWWQVAVLLASSTLIARFVDRGALLTSQAGAQALVIIGLPTTSGTDPLNRLGDAVAGAAVALLVAVLTPGDARRGPRSAATAAVAELSATFSLLADAARDSDPDGFATALVRGRAAEPAIEEWRSVAGSSYDLSRVNAVAHRYQDELSRHVRDAVLLHRAMNSTRVLARRAVVQVPTDDDAAWVASLLARLATATETLADALGAGRDPAVARETLVDVAHDLDPHRTDDWHVQSLVLLLRSPVVDLLEMAELDGAAARDALPAL